MVKELTKEELTEEYIAHREELFAYLLRMTGSYGVAEDLVQDIALIILENDFFNQDCKQMREVLFKIAADLSLHHLQKGKLWSEDVQDMVMKEIFSDSALLYQLDSFKRFPKINYSVEEHISFCFNCLIRTLSPEQQAGFILKELFSFSFKEVSEILEVTLPQTQKLIKSARASLSETFKRRCLLISSQGYCRHCDALNWYYNPQAPKKISTHLFQTPGEKSEENCGSFDRLIEMVKSVNSIKGSSRCLHDFLYDLIISRKNSG